MGVHILVARPVGIGLERDSVATYLSAMGRRSHEFCDGWHTGAVRSNRIMLARNLIADAALAARGAGITHLLAMDADMQPHLDFLESALDFLTTRDDGDRCIVGAPYVGGESEQFQPHVWEIEDGKERRVYRHEVAAREGILEVGTLGSGLLLIPTTVFDKVPPPWYEDEYDGIRLKSSCDLSFCRKARGCGVRIYCDWDHWAGHWQSVCLGKPGTDFLGEA